MFLKTGNDNVLEAEAEKDDRIKAKIKVITKVQKVDTGLYQCQVIIGSTSKLTEDSWVYVRIPPVILDNSTQTVQTTSGAKVFLQCYAIGYPEPKVSWRRENNDILPTGGVVYRGNILAIHNISKHDRGTYYCIADNGVGKGARRHVGVEVEFAPVVYIPKARYRQALGYDMDLYCQVEAYPEPSILWLKDQHQIFDNQREHFITTFSSESGFLETKLRVAEIEEDDYGVYTCKAINKLGHDQKYITLEESYQIECPPVCGLTGTSSNFHSHSILMISCSLTLSVIFMISSVHDKVYLGSNVKVPCFGKKESPKNVKKYTWEHLKKVISNDDRHAIDEEGTLTIYDVSTDDIGIFFCTGFTRSSSKKVKHTIEVIQLPSSSLQILFVYSVKLCNEESKKIAKRFVEIKLKDSICLNDECKIVSIESTCKNELLPIPSLRVTVSIIIPSIPNGNCNPDCTRSNMKDVIEKVTKEAVETIMRGDALKLPEEEEDLAISYYESSDDSVCDPGFEMRDIASKTLCIPCSPGYYLNKGHCIPCHFNKYSDFFAATECHPCGSKKGTAKRAARSKNDCHFTGSIFFGSLIAVFLPLLILITCSCWMIRRYARESALFSFIDKCFLCSKKSPSENDLLQSVVSVTESEPENEEKSTTTIAFSGPGRVSEDHSFDKGAFSDERKTSNKKGGIPPAPVMPTQSMMKHAARNSAAYGKMK
ncbi:Lachesin like protein [Argiope bruennichi]|uniref:Lachesin like protein n=1 Tax=Argiope bruennichi TaxID=94029 RepID=A0A8T0EDM4_ARGBR|nr:Lachesin like protein [Argiope bruennichi]